MRIKANKIIILFLLIVGMTLFTGCGGEKNEVNKEHTIIEVKAGEDVVIKSSEITESATYYNYLTDDGVTIQIFAVKATDGTVRVLFNTCGACNPSPTAYFVQNGDYFECQTCGNRFHRDDIGLTKAIGCSPISILDENKQIDDNSITISSDFIETYKAKFEPINIYEN